jgi:hypothetical protein
MTARRSGQVVIVGAGPYGLAAAAHLVAAGVTVRVFGEPMESWALHMPAGMLLRSRWDASHIADPHHALGLGAYERALDIERVEPVPLERFVDYGRWFQQQAVPELERRRVGRVSRDGDGFRVDLDDGEAVRAARVVVAAGIVPFARRPALFSELSPEVVSHAADHRDLTPLARRRVVVVGGGQSALESAALVAEAGAEVEVLVRQPAVRWLPLEVGGVDGRLRDYAYRRIALGGPRSSWLAARPGLFRRLPYRTHAPLVYHFVKPAGAGWLVRRLASVPITAGRAVVSASQRDGRVMLQLDDGSRREAEHVLLATGYAVDLTRYAFLAPELVARVRTRDGWPELGNGFESSVPGLHFLGAPAGRTFGPVMHFVCGTWACARGLTRALVGRRAPPAGFSW